MMAGKEVRGMIVVKGAHNTALCFTRELEASARQQIQAVCDQEAFSDSRIRIMPDVHAGMGCTIGTTMTVSDKVVPGMVGVDIGCGMETVLLKERSLDYGRLDALIRRRIPSGRAVRLQPHPLNQQIDLAQLRCKNQVKLDRARLSIGTLGGGNHFIEVNRDETGALYLVVHSGSRHLGHEVASHYQAQALRQLSGPERSKNRRMKQRAEKALPVPRDLAYLSGELLADYLHDMRLTQAFASLNRQAMTEEILAGMGLEAENRFSTIHNYIDLDSMILRKGAVSAREGERLLIPINMRDGSLLCRGKGNQDWNESAPHGAGRLMSRREASQSLSLQEYQAQMAGIYTTSVSRETLDEAPMAYKSMDTILDAITPTADVLRHLKPEYNFKARE